MGSLLVPHLAATAEVPSPLRASYFHPTQSISSAATPDEQSAVIGATLDRMQASGFNAIFAYFTGSSGQAYYRSGLHATRAYGDDDPLATLCDEAGRRNLQVFAVVCATVCGNEQPAGKLLEHPEWALRHPDGSPLGYLSPAHADARQWLADVAREVVDEYRPAGVVLDYIRYHNRPLLLDPAGETRFQATVPADATPDDRQRLLQKFKEDELTELVRLYHGAINAARPGTALGIYAWGPHVAANHQIAQCWPRWVAAGYLDLVNVSGYYHREKYGDRYLEIFSEKMRAAAALNQQSGRPVPLSFALGVNTSHGSLHTADEVRAYLAPAANAGMEGIVAFTWDDLLPMLDELDVSGEFRRFPAPDVPPAP